MLAQRRDGNGSNLWQLGNLLDNANDLGVAAKLLNDPSIQQVLSKLLAPCYLPRALFTGNNWSYPVG